MTFKYVYAILAVIVLIVGPLLFCFFTHREVTELGGVAYYVAPWGDDENPGTFEKPFRTIQKAVSVMKPGDTCYIRGGRYHEEVVINGLIGTEEHPITFMAYPGEKVILDGTEPINGSWEKYNGSIYKTKLTKDIWQLFVNGEMMISARWPNAFWHDGSIWDREKHWGWGNESLDTDGHIYDVPHDGVDLAATGKSFKGAIAILNVGKWKTWARFVKEHEAGSNHFTYDPVGEGYKPVDHYYFLECHLNLLDAEKEWFYDVDTKTLYLWPPGGENPANMDVRGKTQSYAFNIEGSSHIRIKGLNFFATTFRIYGSRNIIVEDCNLTYASYSKRMLRDLSNPEITIAEEVHNFTLRNCIIAYTDGPAIYVVSGRNVTIENCLFHDIDYSCVYMLDGQSAHTIRARDVVGFTFRRNTVHTTGGASVLGISASDISGIGKADRLIEYNHFYNYGLLQRDGAAVQVAPSCAYGIIVRYNWCHDAHDQKYGVRFDGKYEKGIYGTHGLMHHNVAWNIKNIGLRPKGDYHQIYNNLAFNCTYPDIVIRAVGGGMTHSITRNNIAERISGYNRDPNYPIPGVHSNNWQGDIRTQLRDPDNWDFRPKPGAEIIDAGYIIPGITDGYLGSAPDIGPYEYGAISYWIPGRREMKASTPIPPNGAKNVKKDADLMWLEGYKAVSHDVYFGTDRDAVAKADHNSKEYKGNQTNNIFDPGPLEPGKTYYWRIDVITESGTIIKGDVWSFTVENA